MLSAKIYFIFATLFLAFFSVDYASANPGTDQQYLSHFLGKNYEHIKSDDKFDDVLRLLHATDKEIRQAQAEHPLIMLTFTNGKYTLKRNGGGVGDFTMTFKMGETFSTDYINKHMRMTFTQDKNVLTQKGAWDNGKSGATCTYSFYTDKLTVKCRVAQVDTVQTFVWKK